MPNTLVDSGVSATDIMDVERAGAVEGSVGLPLAVPDDITDSESDSIADDIYFWR